MLELKVCPTTAPPTFFFFLGISPRTSQMLGKHLALFPSLSCMFRTQGPGRLRKPATLSLEYLFIFHQSDDESTMGSLLKIEGTHTHTHTHTHPHPHAPTPTHTLTPTHPPPHTPPPHPPTRTPQHSHTHTHSHPPTHTHSHTHTHTHTHTHSHTRTHPPTHHTHIHSHTHAHTHTHTHTERIAYAELLTAHILLTSSFRGSISIKTEVEPGSGGACL
jgi:hypothetical protein